MTIIIFILVLAVLIFVHELGHFTFAKMSGIRVDAFAIGFGPKIIGWKKNETKYSLNLIPFGGYVKIFGENPDKESISGPDSERSFVNKPRYKQALVLVAGVLFNFLFAWLLYICVFTYGVTASAEDFAKYADRFSNSRIMVTDVMADSPADKAGIKAGDNIVSIMPKGQLPEDCFNSDCLSQNTIPNIQNTINSTDGKPFTFTYERGVHNQPVSVDIVPTTGLVDGKYAIGIAMQDVVDLRLPFFVAIYEGGHYTLVMIRETVVGLYTFISTIFHGTANFAAVSGPVGIAGIVGSAAQMGIVYLLMITAIISINLGVINLIPFPALDGGRVLFVAIESIIRKRIPNKFANITNSVGFALLMALMVFVTYKDIAKLIK